MRRLTRDRCDFVVRIPMSGQVSSLNVSVAAGVALFEARRQRLG
jgi:23S rRNA (guanosine2251-2'-O)-methyltransferase